MVITKSERYREILATLARHGIGVVDDEFIKHEAGDRARAEHLRRACEELGTMFVKLGQMLSTLGDLLPEAYRTELPKLLLRPPAEFERLAEHISPGDQGDGFVVHSNLLFGAMAINDERFRPLLLSGTAAN